MTYRAVLLTAAALVLAVPFATAQPAQTAAVAPLQVSRFSSLWAHLGDPYAEELAARVLRENPDILRMAARLDEARAVTQGAGGRRKPRVDASASASHGNDQIGVTDSESLARGGFEARWELDLSGRLRAGVAAARAGEARDEALYEDAAHAVLARMTEGLVTARMLAAQARALEASLKAQDETITLLRSRQSAGLNEATRLELALSTRARTAARWSEIASRYSDTLIGLERITGVPVAELEERLNTDDLAVPQDGWVTAVPLDRLRGNPAVRAAYAQGLAADALAQEARAARWPSLSLTAFLGVQEGSDGLRLSGNPIGSLAAALTAPLFNGGQLKAQEAAAMARREQARAGYEGAVRDALADSALAVNGFDRAQTLRDGYLAAQAHDAELVRLAARRADSGMVSVIEVSEAQDRLAQARLQVAEATGAGHLAYIALIRSLGPGGSQ
ncbi:hypothetical protein ABAC460_14335 [Asticcacaulis sp. AC460]|uniref:TolC family protein n=1 Tax=Asticcacaulis sp. AC460 TaxID=1282360 RepID=UPI0003C3F5CC|nr:TolC family protein [Asticcacaulis sp. AC460]ESQ88955.1 hypothetical protein ABAC460_14335 [Asticcacaulis sp. AC460]